MATAAQRIAASELGDLLPRMISGERLNRDDCLRLLRTDDLTSLGVLANIARERLAPRDTVFRRAMHINHTGGPVPSCPECDAASGNPRLAPDDLISMIDEFGVDQIGELHLAGGSDSEPGVARLTRQIVNLTNRFPRLRVRAFTWLELEQAAVKDQKMPAAVLSSLVDAGLMSLAGGTLVDPSPVRSGLDRTSLALLVRRIPWLQAAADRGLKCELCFFSGEDDDPEIVADALEGIRDIQDSLSVFECFVPLSFPRQSTALEVPMSTGYNHLRAVAIGRLYLDNIARIRSSPFAVGEALAQVAQWYGADDAGSASIAIGSGVRKVTVASDRLMALLEEAGRNPVEI